MNLEMYDSNKLNFVELNYTGDNENFIRCDKESKYVDTEVFNLFTPCYERANKLYEYYGPTKYNSRKIIPLRNELLQNKKLLEEINSKEKLLNYINETFLGREFLETLNQEGVDFNFAWEKILKKIVKLNDDMVKLAEHCADEEKILWVAGY
ncbi:MAG: hypothetical protein GVY19_09395 [Bacteroidetes bacterium]|jgi:hypothetical protein|nr:hypothetical protein [Bacteroidota bacterium]